MTKGGPVAQPALPIQCLYQRSPVRMLVDQMHAYWNSPEVRRRVEAVSATLPPGARVE